MNASDTSGVFTDGLLAEVLVWTMLASFVLLVVMVVARRLNPWAAARGASTDRRAVQFLVIVSPSDPARYRELTRVFLRAENTQVIFDRRRGDRRSLHIRISVERRRAERRQRHTEEDLLTTGWALLRLPA